MPKNKFVLIVDMLFTLTLYIGIFLGVGLASKEYYTLSDIAFSYAYGGCMTIVLSQIVWCGCPLRILEASYRGFHHIPNRNWFYRLIVKKYNNETARSAIYVWCIVSLIVNTLAIYIGILLWRYY